MKAILEFDLSDFDQLNEYNKAIKSKDLAQALIEISKRLRHYKKYEENKEFTEEEFYQIMIDFGLEETLI